MRVWIAKFVHGDSVGIKVNDNIDHYFCTRQRLGHGDTMYKEDDQFGGLDGLISFTKHDVEKALSRKLILHMFEQLF